MIKVKTREAVRALIGQAERMLRDAVEDARADFDAKSERWRDSERGQEADDELTDLENACDELDAINDRLNPS